MTAEELLQDYESTGMTPDEIRQMMSYWNDLDDKVKEWLKADEEDRLIVLPVKRGTTIYFDGRHFASQYAGEVDESDDWYYDSPCIYREWHGEDDFRFYPSDFGTEFFDTREACEQYLLKKYGKVKKSPREIYEETFGKLY